MTNYAGRDVFELIGLTDPNAIESDNQYRMGRITAEVGPKVRIVWDGTSVPQYVNRADLVKYDKASFWLKTGMSSPKDIMSSLQDNREVDTSTSDSVKTQNSDKATEALKMVMSSIDGKSVDLPETDTPVESDKKPRTRRTPAKAKSE